MKVLPATSNDLSEIMLVIEKAKEIMRLNGNLNQWINGYPSESVIHEDIEKNQAFLVVEENEIRGYFCFVKGIDPEPTYRVIKEGNWLNNAPFGVIHRLASDGTIKGIADACFNFCFNEIDNIKVDTHRDNKIMQNYFEKIGFVFCGIINVSDGSERLAYQKSIK